jgi:hypothetical protein
MARVHRMPMTQDIARAIAQDDANRQMVRDGRHKWSTDDYMLACRRFYELWPEARQQEELFNVSHMAR